MRPKVAKFVVTDLERLVLTSSLVLLLSGCVPIPWFPDDPYSDEDISFLSTNDLHRSDVVRRFGQPWANLDVDTFVYIASKKSAYVLVYNAGAAGVNRDYFLVADFDDKGLVSRLERYSDSLRHNHCFNNGICLKSKTFNIPLAPINLDAKAKQFIPEPERCVVYIYRDREGIGMAENGYANISYRNPNSHSFRRLATSVEYGYSRFEFTPSEVKELQIEMQPPKYGGQDDLSDNDPDGEWKEPVRYSLTCVSGSLNFFRLYVPEKNDRGIEFHPIEPTVAKQKIQGMNLLLERKQFTTEELQEGNPTD